LCEILSTYGVSRSASVSIWSQPSLSVTTIVGLDTATADTAVAALRNGELAWDAAVPPAAASTRPVHATALLGLLERAADAVGGWESVSRLAVGVGPGSFTGLRIGVATARGLAQALGLQVSPVRTVDALAAGIGAVPAAAGRDRLVVVDARRGEVFAGLYGPDGASRWDLVLATPDELGKRVSQLPSPPVAGGDGSLRFRSTLEGSGAIVLDESESAHRVSARYVCEIGARAGSVAVTELEPIYIRRPDAELWREQQRKRHDRA
jgi:tRNA threonylcarbamoyladenosine biosynthesis protein TsaB